MNNGCTSTTILTVFEDRTYPLLNDPVGPPTASVDCGATTTTMAPIVSTSTSNLTYVWNSPVSASVSGANTRTLTTNTTGTYIVRVTNTVNGCYSDAEMYVTNGTLTAGFTPDKIFGYAPLTVSLENTSRSSLNNNNINTYWVFGNGTTATLSSVSSTNVVYTQPGTYTISQFVSKGDCQSSFSKVIVVELPSQMVVPNVFTPNGDGVNDLFFLQRADNLDQIHAKIVDRWGHVVYELTTEKGQIEWNGKNQAGQELPEGTYFYSIIATGKDGQAYDLKGNISLVR
jgi:gliding motility-associated-like protein